MKNLPIGEQSFEKLIKTNCVYVDKTKHIYNLITTGSYYFLSRPRRFGKSLLCSTLAMLFSGKRDLFKGLWIDHDAVAYDWCEYPVIHLSMSSTSSGGQQTFSHGLDDLIKKLEEFHQVDLSAYQTHGGKFQKLVTTLFQRTGKQVVILIDEYDKPILNHIVERPTIAEENRLLLREFYGVLKDLNQYTKFLFITGLSRFSRVSIFSELNNLNDITYDAAAMTLCGYTRQEIDYNFVDHIRLVAQKYAVSSPELLNQMTTWYDGYRFHHEQLDPMFAPFSVLNFLKKGEFANYWYTTANANVLMTFIKKGYARPFDFEQTKLAGSDLDKFEIGSIKFETLLFQMGYLTINPEGSKVQSYNLVMPNYEVRISFFKQLCEYMTEYDGTTVNTLTDELREALIEHNIALFIKLLESFIAHIPYAIQSKQEVYYQSIFFIVACLVKTTVVKVSAEEYTSHGRIDAVVRCPDRTYIIEFKLNKSPQEALEQIENRAYPQKFFLEKKPIILVGVNFIMEPVPVKKGEPVSIKIEYAIKDGATLKTY